MAGDGGGGGADPSEERDGAGPGGRKSGVWDTPEMLVGEGCAAQAARSRSKSSLRSAGAIWLQTTASLRSSPKPIT